jgi:uncharacterized protein YraI
MKLGRLAAVILAAATMGTAAAQAAPAYSTANVNMRTGPDTEFPSVGVIPEGTKISVRGCLHDESWCDVKWDDNRGWVFSEYIAFKYRGDMTPLPDIGVEELEIPVVSFRAREYWRRHYVGRPWYKDHDRWTAYKVRPRAGWHTPPKGHRKPGWWREGYQAPSGMRAPEHHWRGRQ